MKKSVLTFGLIGGVLSALMMVVTMTIADRIGMERGTIIGYTTIVLSSLMIFFGVRSYRDNVAGGTITFGKAFQVGILICLLICACYVVTWEILYFNFMHDFWDKYSAHVIGKMRNSGANAAVIQAKTDELRNFKVKYENPLFNSAMTFLEPFPVSLLVTLISAATLRRKKAVATAA